MNTFIRSISAIFLTTVAFNASPAVMGIDNYDDLVTSIEAANAKGRGVIQLARRAEIVFADHLPEITANISIQGNGAVFLSEDEYHRGIIEISSEGALQLSDVHITGFDRNPPFSGEGPRGVIENFGSLQLSRVTFSDNLTDTREDYSLVLVRNHEYALINNSTFYNNTNFGDPIVLNTGDMTVTNSTLVGNTAYVIQRPIALSYISAGISALEGELRIGNTLLNNSSGDCIVFEENLVDLGGNLSSDDSCKFSADKNIINKSTTLGHFGYQGGLVPTVGLEPGSLAIDAGRNDICSAVDARFANRPVKGLLAKDAICDIGAFEYGGGFGNSDLAANGMNGIWYNANRDGHYVHIMRVSPDRVLLNWNTFDQDANQIWIYAVIDTVESTTFSGIAYIYEGGQLVPGADPSGAEAKVWGELEVELGSCMAGRFSYNANDPEFGEGTFPLNRIAFYEGGGCSDL